MAADWVYTTFTWHIRYCVTLLALSIYMYIYTYISCTFMYIISDTDPSSFIMRRRKKDFHLSGVQPFRPSCPAPVSSSFHSRPASVRPWSWVLASRKQIKTAMSAESKWSYLCMHACMHTQQATAFCIQQLVSYKPPHSHSHCHLRVRTLSKGRLLPTFPGFVAVPSGISNCPCPTRQKCRWVVRQLVVTWIQFFHPVAPGPCCLAGCTNQHITLRWFKKHTIHEWYLDTFRAIENIFDGCRYANTMHGCLGDLPRYKNQVTFCLKRNTLSNLVFRWCRSAFQRDHF